MSHKTSVADALVDHMESVAKRVCLQYIRLLEKRVQRLEDDNERLVDLLRGGSRKPRSRSPMDSRSRSRSSTSSKSSQRSSPSRTASSSSSSSYGSPSFSSSGKSTSSDSIKPRKKVDARAAGNATAALLPATRPAAAARPSSAVATETPVDTFCNGIDGALDPASTTTTQYHVQRNIVPEIPSSWWEERVKLLSPEVLLEGTSAGPDVTLRYALNGRPLPYFRRCRIPLFAYGLNGIKAKTASRKALAQLLDEPLPEDAKVSLTRSADGLLWFDIKFDQHVEADGFARLLWATWNGSKPKKRMVVLPEGVELVVADVTHLPQAPLQTVLDGAAEDDSALIAQHHLESDGGRRAADGKRRTESAPQYQTAPAVVDRKRGREVENAALEDNVECGSSCESLPSMDEACAVAPRLDGSVSASDDDPQGRSGFGGTQRPKAKLRFAKKRPATKPSRAAPATAPPSSNPTTIAEVDPVLLFASSITPLETEALQRQAYGILNAFDDHEILERLAMDSNVNPLDRVALRSVVQKARLARQRV